MSNAPTPLDISEFNLKAYKTSIDLQIAMMGAYADFNLKMMEVAKLQVQVETAILRRRILQDAFADFQRARNVALRRSRELHELAERYSAAIDRLTYLVMGETCPPFSVSYGWRGFWFLTSRSTVSTVVSLSKIKCSAADRKGDQFFRLSDTSAAIPNPPSTIGTALELMDWARKQLILPRLGSSPYERLYELLKILGDGAQAMLEDAKADYKEADEELKRIREKTWTEIKVDAEKPK